MGEQDQEAALAASRETVRRARSAAGAIERQILELRSGMRTPGATNVALFQPAKLAGVVGNLQQPVLQDDCAEHDAKRGEAATLETRLAAATENAQKVSDEHRRRFNEDVV